MHNKTGTPFTYNYRNRHAKDPDLNVIAHKLGAVQWVFPLNEDEKQTCTDLANTPGAPRKLVAPLPDYKSWAIRTYLGGYQRIVGIVQGPNLEVAFRFADMIKMHFWKHRIRGAVEPGDSDLNLSAERAKADLTHETGAVQLIGEIEAHLIKTGALYPLEGATDRDKAARDRKSRQRTLTGCLMETQELWADKVAELTKALSDVVRTLELQGELIKCLNGVIKNAPVYIGTGGGNWPQPAPGWPMPEGPTCPSFRPDRTITPGTGTPLPQQPFSICGKTS